MLWRFRREIIFLLGLIIAFFFIAGLKKNIFSGSRSRILNQQVYPLDTEELLQENRRLRELLKFKEKLSFTSVICAEVTNLDPLIWPTTASVNKGTKDGIGVNFVALDNKGNLVGKVIRCEEDSSQIQTLLHPGNKISAITQDSREIGVIESGWGPYLEVKYLPADSNIAINEKALTSGLGGIYPKGILIGKICSMGKSKNSLFASASVKPGVDFNKLEEIFLVH